MYSIYSIEQYYIIYIGKKNIMFIFDRLYFVLYILYQYRSWCKSNSSTPRVQDTFHFICCVLVRCEDRWRQTWKTTKCTQRFCSRFCTTYSWQMSWHFQAKQYNLLFITTQAWKQPHSDQGHASLCVGVCVCFCCSTLMTPPRWMNHSWHEGVNVVTNLLLNRNIHESSKVTPHTLAWFINSRPSSLS